MGTGIKLKGFKEFERFAKELPEQPLRRAVRGALTASAKPIRKKARDNLKKHKRSGGLVKSIATKSLKRGKRGGAVVVAVGATTDAPHAHLVEFGTGPRKTKKGKSTGSMPALGFLRNAIDTQARAQRQILEKELRIRIEKEARKLAAKKLK